MGAGILIKGTNLGFISGADGSFALKDVKFPATLVVSYIGYSDQEITVNGNEGHIRIVFNDSMNLLDEVVVVGYGTQKKVNVTGAVTVVDGATLNKRPVTNTAMALQGADPSIIVTTGNCSIEASEYSMSVRGKVSLNSGSPLAALVEEAWTPGQEGEGNLYGLGFWISSRNPKIVFLEGFDPGVQFFSFYNRGTKRSLTICLNDEKMNCDEVFARYYSEVE
jgi:hypothetical protein